MFRKRPYSRQKASTIQRQARTYAIHNPPPTSAVLYIPLRQNTIALEIVTASNTKQAIRRQSRSSPAGMIEHTDSDRNKHERYDRSYRDLAIATVKSIK